MSLTKISRLGFLLVLFAALAGMAVAKPPFVAPDHYYLYSIEGTYTSGTMTFSASCVITDKDNRDAATLIIPALADTGTDGKTLNNPATIHLVAKKWPLGDPWPNREPFWDIYRGNNVIWRDLPSDSSKDMPDVWDFTATTSGHFRINGFYKCALRIHAQAAAIVPGDNMAGVIGDEVPGVKNDDEKHFVTPKSSNTSDHVLLKAKDMTEAQFNQFFEWSGSIGNVSTSNGAQFEVPRNAPVHAQVFIKAKSTGEIVDTMNVWVVSATLTPVLTGISAIFGWNLGNQSGRDPGPDPFGSYTAKASIDWKVNILPADLINSGTNDRPALEKQTRVAPPGVDTGVPSSSNLDASGSDFSGWDVSRQCWASTKYGPALTPASSTAPSPYTPESYPSDPVEGNDDKGVVDEDNNPYVAGKGAIGELISNDFPTIQTYDKKDALQTSNTGTDGDKLDMRLNFHEFCRVQIGDKWYRCSDDSAGKWRLCFQLTRQGGHWNLTSGTSVTFDTANDP